LQHAATIYAPHSASAMSRIELRNDISASVVAYSKKSMY